MLNSYRVDLAWALKPLQSFYLLLVKAYLKDVLARLPTQTNYAINDLLPYNWMPAGAGNV
jgi:hypothetical protein